MRLILTGFAFFLASSLAQGQLLKEKYIPYAPPLSYVESTHGLSPPTLDGGAIGFEMGDVNQDGFVDLVSIGDHGCPYVNTDQHGIMVWFGNGTGDYWNVSMIGDFGYGDVALGDVNNDGFMDVGYGMHHDYSGVDLGNQLLEVALGDGSGQNWTAWDDHLGEDGQSWGMFGTDFADVDADGDLDVGSVSFGAGDGMHVYLNNGDGTWTHSFGFLGGNCSCEMRFGDVNGDGFPDIAAGHQSGAIWLGDGAGHFTKADSNLPSPGGYGNYDGPDLGDVNGDGRDDFSFVVSGGGVNVWSFNPVTGRWTSLSQGLPTSSSNERTRLRDMDGDGKLDLATYGKGVVTIWKRDGAGTWNVLHTLQTGAVNPTSAETLQVGDVDFNGRPDVLVVGREGSWPSDHNKLHFFREASKPAKAWVRLDRPSGLETFKRGAVVFLDWTSAVPASGGGASTIDLKLSLTGPAGPYTDIATGVPDNGRHQWSIPAGLAPSQDCRLKAILHTPQGDAAFVMGKSFTLD